MLTAKLPDASSLEKIRLGTSLFDFAKVAQPTADEPIALLWSQEWPVFVSLIRTG